MIIYTARAAIYPNNNLPCVYRVHFSNLTHLKLGGISNKYNSMHSDPSTIPIRSNHYINSKIFSFDFSFLLLQIL
jgi:hypothetical protein